MSLINGEDGVTLSIYFSDKLIILAWKSILKCEMRYVKAVKRGISRGQAITSSTEGTRDRKFSIAAPYEIFLDKLQEFSGKFDVKVRSYCLIPNHFHLYVLSRKTNLSRFMQSFLTSFCYVMNPKSGRSGHIFQGRFKNHVADDETYGMVISRYIHLNPVKIKSTEDLELEKKLGLLEEFKHSSYRLKMC